MNRTPTEKLVFELHTAFLEFHKKQMSEGVKQGLRVKKEVRKETCNVNHCKVI